MQRPALARHRVAVIPVECNAYTVGKTMNRPATAIMAGLGVVGDAIPSYEELRPLKVLASRMACAYRNPGPYVRGGPLVQGMRVALSAEVKRTHEELVERILHAGLAYADAVDRQTSLVICNENHPVQGKGYAAHELGVPLVSDAAFMDRVEATVGGTGADGIQDLSPAGEQFALF